MKELLKLFGKGHLSWAWARSIRYGMMLLGLLKEGNYYRVEVWYQDDYLSLILRDYYTGCIIQEYRARWGHEELPLPLSKDSQYYRGLALGVSHTNPKNSESYFSKW